MFRKGSQHRFNWIFKGKQGEAQRAKRSGEGHSKHTQNLFLGDITQRNEKKPIDNET